VDNTAALPPLIIAMVFHQVGAAINNGLPCRRCWPRTEVQVAPWFVDAQLRASQFCVLWPPVPMNTTAPSPTLGLPAFPVRSARAQALEAVALGAVLAAALIPMAKKILMVSRALVLVCCFYTATSTSLRRSWEAALPAAQLLRGWFARLNSFMTARSKTILHSSPRPGPDT
jgi:hypothetical protein